MTVDSNVKQQVREFYDQVGWQEAGEGVYQNAHYEDLRPVSREYIHRCHLRILRHLKLASVPPPIAPARLRQEIFAFDEAHTSVSP